MHLTDVFPNEVSDVPSIDTWVYSVRDIAEPPKIVLFVLEHVSGYCGLRVHNSQLRQNQILVSYTLANLA